ncbi:hypothetical protein FJ543_14725 [Mesorhizobium sp. B2-5-7]|nr:hypothetical protein FJ543_14725 [Mesorhizobium sp. B2-5-7]
MRLEQRNERFAHSGHWFSPLSLCFYAIPKGKRCALFPGNPLLTFPGIAPAARGRARSPRP